MARTAKRYKKNTEKKISGIPVCMAAIYARLSVDNDEKKSESIETQVTLIKEFIQKHNENPDRECEIVVYDIYSDLGKTGTNFIFPDNILQNCQILICLRCSGKYFSHTSAMNTNRKQYRTNTYSNRIFFHTLISLLIKRIFALRFAFCS